MSKKLVREINTASSVDNETNFGEKYFLWTIIELSFVQNHETLISWILKIIDNA